MKLSYIEDKEANLEKNDFLGTKAYVETLLKIIKKAKSPFTIGLFGGWGSGKSSIIRTVEEKFNKDKKSKTKVFVYDAWKYSKDSFRRTFILELKERFGLDAGSEYRNFYNDEHKDIDHQVVPKKGFWIKVMTLSPILLLFIWIPAIEINSDAKIVLTIVSPFLALITFLLREAFIEYRISITKPKTFAPEQFEDAFSDAIQKITRASWVKNILNWFSIGKKTIHAETVVIVIDNIDRCHKELQFELLLTIKNFLEKKGTIFIVPIDDREVKKHIRGQGNDENEFLRKLFNTTLTIKQFSEGDLFDLAQNLVTEHALDLPVEIIDLVTQEFSRNPRRVIQFLNVLQTEIKLAEEQEKAKSIPSGAITQNLEFFTVLLLVREEWPDLYAILNNDPHILEAISQSIEDSHGSIKISETKSLTEDQIKFFTKTRHLFKKNLEVFFVNKDHFQNIPDPINNLILSQDWANIKGEYVQKDQVSLLDLVKFIHKRYEQQVVKKGLIRPSGVNIISLVFKIALDKDYGEEFLKYFYTHNRLLGDLRKHINGQKIAEVVLDLEPNLLLNFVKIDLNKNKRCLKEILNLVKRKDLDNEKLLITFITEFSGDETNLKAVSERFSNILESDPTSYERFRNILESSDVKYLVKPSLLSHFIEGFKINPDVEEARSKTAIIESYCTASELPPKVAKEYIQKIIEFLSATNDLENLSFWLPKTEVLLPHTKLLGQVFPVLEAKFDNIHSWYPSHQNNESYQRLLESFLTIIAGLYIGCELTEDEDKKVLNWLDAFFRRVESNLGWRQANNNYFKIVDELDVFRWSFATPLIGKFPALSDEEERLEIAATLNLMLEKTTEEDGLDESQIDSILKSYLGKGNEEIIEQIIEKLVKNKVIKERLIIVIGSLPTSRRLEILSLIKETDKDLLKGSVESILEETELEGLNEVLQKLKNEGISSTIIKGGIKKILRSLKRDDDEDYFEGFIQFVLSNKLLIDQEVLGIIVSKLKALLVDENPKSEKLFALSILNQIKVPEKQKKLVKELLSSLDIDDFESDEVNLYNRVKRKR